MAEQVLFEERQGWSWWVHALIMITFVGVVIPVVEWLKGNVGPAPGQMPFWAAVLSFSAGLGIPVSLYSLMGQLRTRVTPRSVDIRWGFAEIIRKRIPLEEVESAEAVTYSPLREFGGWGIRFGGKGKKAWNVRGNRAVLFQMAHGDRFYLGSERPERILQWVAPALRRRGGESSGEERYG